MPRLLAKRQIGDLRRGKLAGAMERADRVDFDRRLLEEILKCGCRLLRTIRLVLGAMSVTSWGG